MIAILKKELRTYFTTITGYAFLGFFTLITGYFFISQNINSGYANYNDTLTGSLIMFLLLIPILTMRSFSEEARQKTDQLLYCSPIKITDIVLGKFLAAVILFMIGIVITAVFPCILNFYAANENMDVGLTVAGLIGYFLMGVCFISVGIFISVTTDNQLVAAASTFAVIFMLLMMDNIAQSAPTGSKASLIFTLAAVLAVSVYVYITTKNIAVGIVFALLGGLVISALFLIRPNIYDGAIASVLGWFSVLRRFENFYLGIINISDIVYYITFSSLFIYFTVNTIEKRRWA